MCTDQEAVDLIRDIQDPQEASKVLVDHALSRFSTDNLSCMVVRFDQKAHVDGMNKKAAPEGEGSNTVGISESEKILAQARKDAARKSSVSSSGKSLKERTSNVQPKGQADATKSDQEPKPAILLPEDAKKTGGTLSSTTPSELASVPVTGSTQKAE